MGLKSLTGISQGTSKKFWVYKYLGNFYTFKKQI